MTEDGRRMTDDRTTHLTPMDTTHNDGLTVPSSVNHHPSSAETRLRALDVSLGYFDGDTTTYAVDRVSIEIPRQGFIGIMGPSGSGKSSLLYLLSGLKRPTLGDVEMDGLAFSRLGERELTGLRRKRFGFVFQQPFLLNYLTARENVLTAAPQGDPRSLENTNDLLRSLDIEHLADRFPYHLSG